MKKRVKEKVSRLADDPRKKDVTDYKKPRPKAKSPLQLRPSQELTELLEANQRLWQEYARLDGADPKLVTIQYVVKRKLEGGCKDEFEALGVPVPETEEQWQDLVRNLPRLLAQRAKARAEK